MRRGRKEGHKTFTFAELMLLIIIVGILVPTAVPLYTGYVERKRVTEATKIMGAIATSQIVEKTRTTNCYSASTIAEFKARGIEITDTKFFTYETVATPNGGFTVTATTTASFGAAGGTLTYTYDPAKGGWWGNDEPIILKDYQLLQT